MFCNKCGAKLKDNAKFCNKCGTPVSDNQAVDNENETAINGETKTSAKTKVNSYANDMMSDYEFASFGFAAKLLIFVVIASFVATLISFWPNIYRAAIGTLRNWWYYFPLIVLLIIFSMMRTKNPALAIGVVCVLVKQFMLFINAIKVGEISNILGVALPQLLAWLLVLVLVLINTVGALEKLGDILNKLFFLPFLLYLVAIILFLTTGGTSLFAMAVNPFNFAQIIWLILNIMYWVAEAIAILLICKCLVKS